MAHFPHKKILVVVSRRLGDTMFCTPAIQFLHLKFPELKIDVLALSPVSADVLANNPAVNHLYLIVEKEEDKRSEECKKIACQYDLIIGLHHDEKDIGFLSELSNESWIPPKYKTELKTHPSTQKLTFLQKKLNCEIPTESERFFLYPQKSDHEKLTSFLKSHGLDSTQDHLIACHLGCSTISRSKFRLLSFWKRWQHEKVWPTNNYIRLLKQLNDLDPKIKILLTGTNQERVLADKLTRKNKNFINIIDGTSVHEMAALMSHLKVFITGDTGPLHVACTTPVNMIVFYGQDFEQQIMPYPKRDNHTVIEGRTVAEISVNQVYQTVAKFLRK